MATEYKLEVTKRENWGKKASKDLRKEGIIPGIYYSSDSKESISFSIEKTELRSASKSGARLYSVNVGGKPRTVLFKNVQYHPVTEEILHIDLYGVNMNKAVSVKVQLALVGTAIGVSADGGVLVQSLNEIDIECLPGDIPENIEVDISELALGDTLRAENLKLDEKFTLNTNNEQVIASVTQAMKEEELVPDLEESTIEGDAPESSTESDTSKEEKDAESTDDNNKEEESKKE